MSKKLNVKIKSLGLMDLIAFTKLIPNRKKRFNESIDYPIVSEPPVNKLAKAIHPKKQILIVKDIIKESLNVVTYILEKKDGTPPAYFRAGQYISLKLSLNGSLFTRPYSLSSSPKDAINGKYAITIKKDESGFFSKWVIKNWKIGTQVTATGAEGTFYYEPIRDAKTVIGVCGGSGVTPFKSLAKAIAEGTEDFELILLYGSCTAKDILFSKEFSEYEKSTNTKVKVVNVLSEDKKKGCEEGFITAELIEKYAPKDKPYSIFICGPQVMYDFVSKEIKKLNLSNKYIRRELFGEVKEIDKVSGYPKAIAKKVFKLTVITYDKEVEIDAKASESLLVAIERAGIIAPSKCRSGVCGYCRSKLVEGDVFIPEDNDGRREADKKFGFIHLCSSYPKSNVTVELPATQE